MVKRVVNVVDVVDVEKRRYPSKHYVYVVNVTWSDGSQTVIYRRYSRFFELQVRILELFPEEGGAEDPSKRMVPFLPGKKIFGRSHIRNVALKRLSGIDDYCSALIRLPPHLSECFDVLQFFQVEDEDLNPIREEKDKRKSQVIGDVISEPMMLEQYVAIADYKKKQKNEVNLQAHISVEVVEKNENGWWFVNVEDEQGWVPASYLEPAEGGGAGKEGEERAKKGEEEKFVTVQEYEAQNRDEISFEKGVVVEVVEKNLEGWWVVRYQGKEGVVPAAYLQYMIAKPMEGKKESEVQVVATASAAVSDALSKQAAEDSVAKATKKESGKPAVQRVPSQQNAVPPRRQSIKVTKKMRSQSRTGGAREARAAAAASAISESLAEASPARKVPKKSSAGALPSGNHVLVACDYEAVGGSELSVHEGDLAEVVERNESGWWYVKNGNKEGWVPSSSFDTSSEAFSPPGSPGRALAPVASSEELIYMTIGEFTSAADDGISFATGCKVEVFEKAASGWWFVAINGKEGWAPSSYIEKKAAPGSSSAPSASSEPAKPVNVAAAAAAAVSKAALRPSKSGGNVESAGVGKSSSSGDSDMKSELTKISLKPTGKSLAKAADTGSSTTDGATAERTPARSVSGGVRASVAAATATGGLDLSKIALKPVGSGSTGGGKGAEPAKPPVDPPKPPAAAAKLKDARQTRPGSVVKSSAEPARPVDTPAKPAAPPSKSPKLPVKAASSGAMKLTSQPRTPLKPASSKSDEQLKVVPPVKASKSPTPPKRPTAVPDKAAAPKYLAIGDYKTEDADSLCFKDGDLLELVEKSDSGWWMMKLGSKEGWAPSTYFEEAGGKASKSGSVSVKANSAGASAGPAGVGALAAQLSQIQGAKLKKTSASDPVKKTSSSDSVKKTSSSDSVKKTSSSDSVKIQEAPKPKSTGPPIPKLPSKASVKTNGYDTKASSSAKKSPARPSSPAKKGIQKADSSQPTDGEVYVVTANYTAEQSEEISLRDGQQVTVVEKAETGWWCVRSQNGQEGWAPSTYLEKQKKKAVAKATHSAKPMRPKAAVNKKAGNRASAAYHGEEGEVSFEEGESLEVLERADTGWWFVRTNAGVEGWAPSTYIQQ